MMFVTTSLFLIHIQSGMPASDIPDHLLRDAAASQSLFTPLAPGRLLGTETASQMFC